MMMNQSVNSVSRLCVDNNWWTAVGKLFRCHGD